MVPLLFHRSAMEAPYEGEFAALQLLQFVDRSGAPRFRERKELEEHFAISPQTRLVVSGVDGDPQVERWWRLGKVRRSLAIEAMRSLGVDVVTTPNFSVLTDVPRWGDLHSISRIAITFLEFAKGGVPVALHTNARTTADFERWGQFVAEHAEVDCIAYEFATGASWGKRREFHLQGLQHIARQARRPLQLIVRGGLEMLPRLADMFQTVTLIDTSPFLKTQKRNVAVPRGNAGLEWRQESTDAGQSLHELLQHNCQERLRQIELLCARGLRRLAAE